MEEALTHMVFWHWFILGAALMAVETFAPGAFFLWPGLSAVIVGILKFAFPVLDWQACVGIWAVLSLVTVLGWIMYRKNNPAQETAYPNLNRRAEQYVGRRFTLDTPLVNGKGEMKVDDGLWRVMADQDIQAGATVEVTATEGNALRVVVAE